jgi:hypothetical protein
MGKQAGIFDLKGIKNKFNQSLGEGPDAFDILKNKAKQVSPQENKKHLRGINLATKQEIQSSKNVNLGFNYAIRPKATILKETGKTLGKGVVGGLAAYGGKKLYDKVTKQAALPGVPSVLNTAARGGLVGGVLGGVTGGISGAISDDGTFLGGAAKGALGGALVGGATNASPGVAAKLTASGVGTMISLQAQSQVAQSQMVSLLTQMLADGAEKESRKLVSTGTNFKNLGEALQGEDKKMSTLIVPLRMEP